MVKLFLAEDEIAMREGIRRTIPWKEIGIEFCGEASDGELAWPQILEQRPDIVITDIKMPFMDGLQLSGLIRRELPDTKIVILSGYGEFQYAQEALRMGVAEYLLKPITPRQLRDVIEKLACSIEAEKKSREEHVDGLEEELREKAEHDRRLLFKALVSGGMSSHDILARAEELGFRLIAPFYRLLLFYVLSDAEAQDQGKGEEMLLAVSDCPEDSFVFEHSVDSLAILLAGRTPEETMEKTGELEEKARAFLQSEGSLHYFLSAGRPVSHLSEIHQVYQEVVRAASYRFFLPPDQTVTADMPFRQLLAEDNPINTDTVLQTGNLRTIWESFLRTGTLQEAGDFVEDVFSSVGEDNAASLLFLHYLTMDCYFSLVRFLKEMGKGLEEFEKSTGDINAVIGTIGTPGDSKRYLKGCLEEAIRQRDKSASRRNGQLLQKALDYIEVHFSDGSLSLQSVAAVAGFSPNRFSTLFSHEMGMTFIDYLIAKRMEKACELLMNTDMKAFEVAYSSGYNDPHYFSATFKKLKGMSPMEYRRRGKQTDGNSAK